MHQREKQKKKTGQKKENIPEGTSRRRQIKCREPTDANLIVALYGFQDVLKQVQTTQQKQNKILKDDTKS